MDDPSVFRREINGFAFRFAIYEAAVGGLLAFGAFG